MIGAEITPFRQTYVFVHSVQNQDDDVWERGGRCRAAVVYELVRLDVEQIQAQQELQKHVCHLMLQVTASASI